MPHTPLNLIDNASIAGREDQFKTVDVNVKTVLESWKVSLFSFEWLLPDGSIRVPEELPENEKEKYQTVLAQYESGKELERPILGIGVMDNVEIGSRRDVFLTLTTVGFQHLSVHIPKANENDFTPYL